MSNVTIVAGSRTGYNDLDKQLQPTARTSEAEIVLREAMENSSKLSRWYNPETDHHLYNKAYEACVKVNITLANFKLSPEDQSQLLGGDGAAFVVRRLREMENTILAKEGEGKWMNQIKSWTTSLCEIATRFGGIIQMMVPQSPEYAVPAALLLFLFKIVSDKKKKLTTVSQFLVGLSESLPVANFCQEAFPTNAMKITVASMYVQTLGLLERAVKYYHLGYRKVLIDVFIERSEYKFEDDISAIERLKRRMIDLRDVGHIAQQADLKTALETASTAMASLHEKTIFALDDLRTEVATLKDLTSELQQQNYEWRKLKAIEQSHALLDLLIPDLLDPLEEAVMARQANERQSAKDRWQNNGIQELLPTRFSLRQQSILWVSGDSGNQDPWVTGFSVDVFETLRTEEHVVASIFGHTGTDESPQAADFGKILLARIIESAPNLSIDCPELLSLRRFRRPLTPMKVWDIIDSLLLHLKSLFLILDRIDAFEADGDGLAMVKLVLELLALAERHGPKVKILVTTEQPPPRRFEQDQDRVLSIWLSTRRKR